MSEKILDRIRKLLRLASDKGATQEEAESALLMAQRLMVEHGLNESQVEEAPTPDEMKIEEGAYRRSANVAVDSLRRSAVGCRSRSRTPTTER